jgi:hypothetical protein
MRDRRQSFGGGGRTGLDKSCVQRGATAGVVGGYVTGGWALGGNRNNERMRAKNTIKQSRGNCKRKRSSVSAAMNNIIKKNNRKLFLYVQPTQAKNLD